MDILVFGLIVLQVIGESAGQCVDLDPTACSQQSSMCQDTTLATMVCPKYCGLCGCNRDIEILIQDSKRRNAPPIIKQYLKDLVNRMEIGPTANKIGVALYDNNPHNAIDLSNTYTKFQLISAINNITFTLGTNSVDKEDVISFLHERIEEHHVGDRFGYPNVFIFLYDHTVKASTIFGRSAELASRSHGSDPDRIETKNVIVINAGVANSASPFTNLATDSNHVIHVSNIHDLHSTLPKLLNLICQ
ncbi:hypothetical protein ACF0H5_012398 [Mactra antiquata]